MNNSFLPQAECRCLWARSGVRRRPSTLINQRAVPEGGRRGHRCACHVWKHISAGQADLYLLLWCFLSLRLHCVHPLCTQPTGDYTDCCAGITIKRKTILAKDVEWCNTPATYYTLNTGWCCTLSLAAVCVKWYPAIMVSLKRVHRAHTHTLDTPSHRDHLIVSDLSGGVFPTTESSFWWWELWITRWLTAATVACCIY